MANSLAAATLRQLRSRIPLVVCLGLKASDPRAYLAGFSICLEYNCCNEQLLAKLEHAQYLQQVQLRLAQAEKLESIGELAAGIAHEINTPIQYVGDNTRFVQDACKDLNGVLENCQQLIAAMQDSGDIVNAAAKLSASMEHADVDYLISEIPAAIEQTLEGVDRVANIVRAMKEFAHPGASEMTPTNLSTAISNTVMVARNEWKYVAEVGTDFQEDLPLVPCLPGKINQVLLNMIVNAAHAIGATENANPTKGRINISTRLVDPHAEIRITDTGRGIAPENIDRIFTPFFTTKAAGKGTGQGLAIAHTVIVEKHNGSIDVQSNLGEGTTFIIRIPLEHHPPVSPDLANESLA